MLYMKHNLFSSAEPFTIKDGNGYDRYYVVMEGGMFSRGQKLRLMSPDGREAACIARRGLSPVFEISVDGRFVTEMTREFALLSQLYTFSHLDWTVESGTSASREYMIVSTDQNIALMRKTWLSWGDCYEVDLAPGTNEVLAVAAVLVIYYMLASAAG